MLELLALSYDSTAHSLLTQLSKLKMVTLVHSMADDRGRWAGEARDHLTSDLLR